MAIADAQAAVTWTDTVESSANRSLAFGSNVTSGNLLVLILGTTSHSAGSCSVSDTQGNTWSACQVDAYLDPHGVGFFFAVAGSSAACTVTVNKNGASTAVNFELREISGWNGTTALDGAAVSNTGTGTNGGLTMSATSIADDYLLTAICGDPASAFTPGTVATGFSAGSSLNNETTFTQLKTATRKPGATGTYSAGWPSMTNAGSNKWAVLAFAIKGQAGGGGGGTIVNPLSGRGGATAIPLVS